jgi:hypothetical protein
MEEVFIFNLPLEHLVKIRCLGTAKVIFSHLENPDDGHLHVVVNGMGRCREFLGPRRHCYAVEITNSVSSLTSRLLVIGDNKQPCAINHFLSGVLF